MRGRRPWRGHAGRRVLVATSCRGAKALVPAGGGAEGPCHGAGVRALGGHTAGVRGCVRRSDVPVEPVAVSRDCGCVPDVLGVHLCNLNHCSCLRFWKSGFPKPPPAPGFHLELAAAGARLCARLARDRPAAPGPRPPAGGGTPSPETFAPKAANVPQLFSQARSLSSDTKYFPFQIPF